VDRSKYCKITIHGKISEYRSESLGNEMWTMVRETQKVNPIYSTLFETEKSFDTISRKELEIEGMVIIIGIRYIIRKSLQPNELKGV
jgi:hypothetical protein